MESLPAPFRINPGLIIWTLVVFILLWIVLAKALFPTIVKMTADREARIKKDLEDAERLRIESQAALDEQRELLASARGEAQAIITEAREAAERERSNGIEKTRAEQEDLLARARREIEAEKVRAIAEVRREAVDIALAAAGKVVGARLDAAADRKIVEDYIGALGTSGVRG
jgi:F-type H+-transporting ATPase subunit b